MESRLRISNGIQFVETMDSAIGEDFLLCLRKSRPDLFKRCRIKKNMPSATRQGRPLHSHRPLLKYGKNAYNEKTTQNPVLPPLWYLPLGQLELF